METGEDAPWVVDAEISHDGVSSVRSGGDGSYLQGSVRGAGTLSFWWRAQCEEPGYEYYDYGAFKVGGDIVARIAGEDTGWEFVSTKLASTAKHIFRWEYHKDDEGSYAPDCIWLDQVQWIPADGSGTTLTTPEPVPYAWLMQYELGADSDFETAANAFSGKVQGGAATQIWQEYVAGTDPTDENDVLRASITFDADGRPVIGHSPEFLDAAEAAKRTYTIYGKVNLNDARWVEVSEGEEVNYHFFKVTVEMK